MSFTPTTWTSPPPTSSDRAERARQEHTRQRVRIITGQHAEIVRERTRKQAGAVRSAAWGEPDLSSNVLAASSRALATLYDPDLDEANPAPTVSVLSDPTVGPAMDEVLQAGGIWPLMARVQAQTLALREMVIRVDVSGTDDEGRPVIGYRPITPDLVEAVPDPRDPSRPIEIRELRFRVDPRTGQEGWTREVWSIVGGVGRHYVLDASGNDVSELWGLPKGGLVGDAYPARRANGRPFLPYVVHHAELTGALWDSFAGIEVVEGTLTCCVHLTLVGHILRNAAWAQRYTANVEIDGAQAVDARTDAERQAVVADPSTVARFRSTADVEDGADPVFGQWASPADPQRAMETVIAYERRLHSMAGLDPADAARISGDPRSGYALAVSRASKEVHALRFAPTFARSDAEMVTITACLYNRAVGFQVFPESGWVVEHAPIRAIRRRAQAARQTPNTTPDPAAAAA